MWSRTRSCWLHTCTGLYGHLYRQGCLRLISITSVTSSYVTANIKSRKKNIALWRDLSLLDQDWIVVLHRRYNLGGVGSASLYFSSCLISVVKCCFVVINFKQSITQLCFQGQF